MAGGRTKAARRNLKAALNGSQEDAEKEWEVEAILDEKKGKDNVTKFLVKWKDFDLQNWVLLLFSRLFFIFFFIVSLTD